MQKLPIVISASRMTDMPAFYPHQIIQEIEARKSKGLIVHTIVLWTKHAASIFREPLFSYLAAQQNLGTQIYIQLTITGLGKDVYLTGTDNRKVYLEPCVPSLPDSVKFLERIIEFTGNPERLRLRIDPLVRLKNAEGEIFSNYDVLPEMIDIASPMGVKHFSFSFLEKDIYKKVDQRFTKRGIEILPPDHGERMMMGNEFSKIAYAKDITISACSVPGLPVSACIDGNLLQKLHNHHWPLDLSQPHNRTLCGCTKSIDIGGWPPKSCKSGCLYCYSRPVINEF